MSAHTANERSEAAVDVPRLVRLEIVLEVPITVCGSHPEEIEWFERHILMAPEDTIMHSNVVGDEIGVLRSVKILEANDEAHESEPWG
jgi:hypothetical protein